MIKHSVARTLFLGGVLVLTIVITTLFAVSHSTHAAPAGGYTRPPGQSNIQQPIGKMAHFNPDKLSCTRPSGQSCSISIKNMTKASQTVTLNTTVSYTLAPGQIQPISYTTAGTYVYSLASNSKATLKVIVT